MRAERKAERDWRYKAIGTIKHFTRIASNATFERVYKHAAKVWHTPYFVIFYQRYEGYEVGFVASKKIGNAVKRNRAKRILRAHFIEAADTLPKGRYVFVAKAPLLETPYTKRHTIFLHALKRCTSQRKTPSGPTKSG
jgi:ribonuclease P protein component